MRARLLRMATAPVRWYINLAVDTLLGPDELAGREWPSTTPDPLSLSDQRELYGPGVETRPTMLADAEPCGADDCDPPLGCCMYRPASVVPATEPYCPPGWNCTGHGSDGEGQ